MSPLSPEGEPTSAEQNPEQVREAIRKEQNALNALLARIVDGDGPLDQSGNSELEQEIYQTMNALKAWLEALPKE